MITRADGDGGNARPLLARPGYDYNAALSPDGQWVVFTSERDGSANIYRVRRDGSGLEQLTDHVAYDDHGALSPDGRWLAFVSTRSTGNANIWLLELATGRLRNLTAGSPGDFRPAWSVDGAWLAFTSVRDTAPARAGTDPEVDPKTYTTDLYLIRPDGSGLRRLTSSGGIYSPSWSPDGRRIACTNFVVQGGGLARPPAAPVRVLAVEVATGDVSVLVENTGEVLQDPHWISPTRLAYVSQPGPAAEDAVSRTIRFNDGTAEQQGEFGGPHWSADGQTLVFHRQQIAMPADAALQGVLGPAISAFGSPSSFRPMPALDPGFRVMRTGIFPPSQLLRGSGELVMNNQPLGAMPRNSILALSIDGTKIRTIYADPDPQRRAVGPAVSPDGGQIAFGLGSARFLTEGTSRLVLIRADGTNLRELAAAGDHAGFPAWSPDGTKLAFVNGAPWTERGLRILDLASGKVTVLTTGPDMFPSWSPRGDRIVFTRSPAAARSRGLDGASQLYTIRPDGTGLSRLTFSPGAQEAHPAWSPDGQWIAFVSARITPRDETGTFTPHHSEGQIFVVRPDGTDLRQLTDNQYSNGTPGWLHVPP